MSYCSKDRSKLKIVASIEARMGSSRLPGKVLKPVLGKPSLEWLIDRLGDSKYLNQIIVATTDLEKDQPLVDFCKTKNITCFRGSEQDVLDRVLKAVKSVNADLIVEITGDATLNDPDVVDECIELFLKTDADYVSNILDRSFPRGIVVQVFPTAVLEEVARLTQDPDDREHVSLYIYNHPERYQLQNLYADEARTWPELAVVLDTPEDYELIKKIAETLYPQNPKFRTADIIRLLKERPDIRAINAHIQRKPVKRLFPAK